MLDKYAEGVLHTARIRNIEHELCAYTCEATKMITFELTIKHLPRITVRVLVHSKDYTYALEHCFTY